MYAFSHVWLTQHETDLENFHIVFKQRVKDELLQNVHVHIDKSKSIKLYKNFFYVLPLKLRTVITKLRVSAHQLRIVTGRYARNHIKVEECKSHVLIRTLSYFSEWKR